MNIDRSSLSSTLPSLKYSRRLRAGGIAAGATLAPASSASAAVVVTEVGTDVAPNAAISFDPAGPTFVTGSDNAFDATLAACGSSVLLGSGFNANEMNWATDGTSSLTTFNEGQVIANTSVFHNTSDGYSWTGDLPAADETIYLGYRIDGQGAGNDESYYGYVRITGHETAVVTFDRYAFNDIDDSGITAGAIPEPATTALGLGIFVLACFLGKRLIRRNKTD